MNKEQRAKSKVQTNGHIAFGMFFLASWVIGEIPKFFWPWPITFLDVSALPLLLWNVRSIFFPKLLIRVFLILSLSWLFSLRIFSIIEALPGLLYLVRTAVFGLLIVNARNIFDPVKKHIPLSLWIFTLSGILQYALVPDTRFLLRYGWDEHYYRLIGTILDPNYAGAMFGIISLFALHRFFKYKKHSFALLGIASVISLALTFSRAAWLTSGIALVIYLYKSRVKAGKKILFFLLGGFALVFAIAPKPGGEGVKLLRTNSIIQRTESWQHAFTIWRLYPFFGAGFNNYNIVSQKLHLKIDPKSHAANAPDSSWLLLLSTSGLIGVIWLAWEIRKVFPLVTKNKFLSVVVVLIGIHSFFNNTLFYPPILALLALMVASLP